MRMREEAVGVIPELDPPSAFLLGEPLDFILADHFRQRAACGHLKRFAENRQVDGAQALALADFLSSELPLHHADEEDLFLTLLRRALPADNLADVILQLQQDHVQTTDWSRKIVTTLRAAKAGVVLPLNGVETQIFNAYAAGEHRHLAIENGVVLAIARVRLTRADLSKISTSMRARRGLGEAGLADA